ncbi:hypothetical protein OIU78_013399, partial [Salix suchowensis]
MPLQLCLDPSQTLFNFLSSFFFLLLRFAEKKIERGREVLFYFVLFLSHHPTVRICGWKITISQGLFS